jgi:hypothetical protein
LLPLGGRGMRMLGCSISLFLEEWMEGGDRCNCYVGDRPFLLFAALTL